MLSSELIYPGELLKASQAGRLSGKLLGFTKKNENTVTVSLTNCMNLKGDLEAL